MGSCHRWCLRIRNFRTHTVYTRARGGLQRPRGENNFGMGYWAGGILLK